MLDEFRASVLPSTSEYPHLLFFLSHHHADHMHGLSGTFTRGKIYCTDITARLVLSHYPALKSLVHVLPYDQATVLLTPPLGAVLHTPANNIHTRYDTSGMTSMTVTCIDANHCPGSAMFIFQGSFGKVLYTGDYRYDAQLYRTLPNAESSVKDSAWGLVLNDKALDAHPLHRFGRDCDLMISDMTFAHPRCEFPPKQVAVKAALHLVKDFVQQHSTPDSAPYDEASNHWKVRVYVAADMLGTEPVLQALCSGIPHAQQCYCHPDDPRYAEMQLLPDYQALVQCTAPHEALIHICEGQLFTQFAAEEQQRRTALLQLHDEQLPDSEPRAVLFMKPSTMWFVQHELNAQVQVSDNSKPSVAAPASNLVSLDKFGVHHVLYSMHSDLYEILELIRAIQPRQLLPMNSPVVLEASDLPHINNTHLHDNSVAAGSSMLQHSTNTVSSTTFRSTFSHNSAVDDFHRMAVTMRWFSEAEVCGHIQQQLRHWLPAQAALIQVVSPSQLPSCLPQAMLPAQYQQLSPIRMTNYHPSVYAAVAIRNRQRLHRQSAAATKAEGTDDITKLQVKRSHSSPVKQAPAVGGKRLITIMVLAPVVKHAPLPADSDTAVWLSPQYRSQLLSHVLDFHTLASMSAWLASDLSVADRQTSISQLKQLGAAVRYELSASPAVQADSGSQRLLIIVDGHRASSQAMLHQLTSKIRQSSVSHSRAVYIYTKYALYAWTAYKTPTEDTASAETPPDLTPYYVWRTGMDVIDKPSDGRPQVSTPLANTMPKTMYSSQPIMATGDSLCCEDQATQLHEPPPLEYSDSPAQKMPRIERAATNAVIKLEFAAAAVPEVILID